jgi:hypothetical protein
VKIQLHHSLNEIIFLSLRLKDKQQQSAASFFFLTISVQRDKVHASFSLFFHHALLNEPQSAALAGCRVILTWGAKEKKAAERQ